MQSLVRLPEAGLWLHATQPLTSAAPPRTMKPFILFQVEIPHTLLLIKHIHESGVGGGRW